MSDKFKVTKENKMSTTFENGKYKATIKNGKHCLRENDISEHWYDDEQDMGAVIQAHYDVLQLTNKETGKTTTKRVYQNNVIGELEYDLNNGKKQFSGMFNKIDLK